MSQEDVIQDQSAEDGWVEGQSTAEQEAHTPEMEAGEAYAEAEEALAGTEEIAATGFRAPDPQELAPWFPQYEIQYLVAVGGMGAVYRAIQKSLDRTVAIKVLPAEFSQDAEFCRSFQSEAKAMAKLNHSNLIGVYDFGDAGGQLFIVMEFVEGHSLHDACHGGLLDQHEAVRMMEGICSGLAHAHENGVLHRDIKPANILLGADQVPKIGDFGLARATGTRIEEGEVIFGTPGYTAPEVLQPPHEFDHRADIFSLGVMLHELLTGKIPDADPRPASAQVRSDPRLDAIIRKATHPQPAMRYSDAMDMAKELSKVAHSTRSKVVVGAARGMRAGAGAGARVGRSPYPVVPQARSGGGMLWLILIALIALVCFLLRAQIMEAINPPPPPPPGPTYPNQGSSTTQPPKNPGSNLGRPTGGSQNPTSHSPHGPTGNPHPSDPGTGGDSHANWEPENAPLVRIKPVRKPGSAEHPEVDPVAASLPPPKIDVNAVFERARSAMADRCKPFHEDYRQVISQYRSEFSRNGRTLLELDAGKAPLLGRFEKFVAALRDQDLAIKEVELPRSLASDSDMVALHRIYKDKEDRAEAGYEEALQRQVIAYAEALKKSAAQLKASNDKGSARKLEWEAERAEADLGYFRGLVESRW